MNKAAQVYHSNNTVDSSQLLLEKKIDEIEELHPIDFRLAFGLTHEQAADILCIEPQTMRAYVKKNPSKRVKKLAAIIAKEWISNGIRQPCQPDLIFNYPSG